MIGVGSETGVTRGVALVAVLVLVTLSLGSVVAAGWQSGTDAVGELESEPDGTMDRSSTTRTWAAVGLAKRDGESDGTRRAGRTDGPNETDGARTEPGDTATEPTARTTSGGETTHEETAYGETTRASEAVSTGNETGCNTDGATTAEPGTDTSAAAGDRNRETVPDHAALESGLWVVGVLGGLTTLFSLGGFVAAVLAYRGTD